MTTNPRTAPGQEGSSAAIESKAAREFNTSAEHSAATAHGAATEEGAATESRYDEAAELPRPLLVLAGWSWRFLVICGAIVILAIIAREFSAIFIGLLAAVLIAVVLDPLNRFFALRLGLSRSLSATLTLLVLALVLAVLLGASGTGIYQGFYDLSDNINQGVQQIVDWVTQTFPQARSQIDSAWQNVQSAVKNNSGRIFGGFMSVSSTVGSFLTGATIAIFALFFFLKDGRSIWHWMVRFFPAAYRDTVNEAGIRAWITFGNYARTQAIVAFVDALGITAIALCLRTPLSFAIPIFTFVLLGAFIPVLGALLSGSLAVIIVLVNTGNVWMALGMFIGVIVVQQVEGNLLQPILQGNALNLHALAIVLLVTAGSIFAGIVGAIFTVPLAAAINVIVLYLQGHDTYPYLNHDKHRPGGPKRSFAEHDAIHWHEFAQGVAQHRSPSEVRREKWDRRRARLKRRK